MHGLSKEQVMHYIGAGTTVGTITSLLAQTQGKETIANETYFFGSLMAGIGLTYFYERHKTGCHVNMSRVIRHGLLVSAGIPLGSTLAQEISNYFR